MLQAGKHSATFGPVSVCVLLQHDGSRTTLFSFFSLISASNSSSHLPCTCLTFAYITHRGSVHQPVTMATPVLSVAHFTERRGPLLELFCVALQSRVQTSHVQTSEISRSRRHTRINKDKQNVDKIPKHSFQRVWNQHILSPWGLTNLTSMLWNRLW